MSESHTRGPWHVCPPTAQRPSRAAVSAMSGFVMIYDAPLTTETAANARLIAASPEMLRAMEDFVYGRKEARESERAMHGILAQIYGGAEAVIGTNLDTTA